MIDYECKSDNEGNTQGGKPIDKKHVTHSQKTNKPQVGKR